MKPSEQATYTSSTVDRLDQSRIRTRERRMARAYFGQSELLADMLLRANEDLRHVFGLVTRSIGALVRRSKVSTATPECSLP